MVDVGLIPAPARAPVPVPAPACAVILHGGDAASGLADVLHQFLLQVVAADPARARRAARLRGALLFRAAEDPAVCVRIGFAGARIDVADHAGDDEPGLPVITSDFVTTAHLTTGEEGPFALVLRRRLRVRVPWRRGPFVLRALAILQLPSPRRRRCVFLAAVVVAALAAATLAWLLLRGD